jgi:hypothetical protein
VASVAIPHFPNDLPFFLREFDDSGIIVKHIALSVAAMATGG